MIHKHDARLSVPISLVCKKGSHHMILGDVSSKKGEKNYVFLLVLNKDQTNYKTCHRNLTRESQQLCPEVTNALRKA